MVMHSHFPEYVWNIYINADDTAMQVITSQAEYTADCQRIPPRTKSIKDWLRRAGSMMSGQIQIINTAAVSHCFPCFNVCVIQSEWLAYTPMANMAIYIGI